MISMNDKTVCIIGLGYVGLPLAEAFSKHLRTIGFDIDGEKLEGLKKDNNEEGLEFTTDPTRIREADFVLISVPTPVAKSKEPDLSYVKSAAEITGKNLKIGATVVLESTVYPGVTEEVVAPVLERESGLSCGTDFKIGYSPERINPNFLRENLVKPSDICFAQSDCRLDERDLPGIREEGGRAGGAWPFRGRVVGSAPYELGQGEYGAL